MKRSPYAPPLSPVDLSSKGMSRFRAFILSFLGSLISLLGYLIWEFNSFEILQSLYRGEFEGFLAIGISLVAAVIVIIVPTDRWYIQVLAGAAISISVAAFIIMAVAAR